MTLADKTITCVECGESFIFSASEQELFASRGYVNEPKRCPACRETRRSTRVGSNDMGGYRGPRQMFQVTCADCGNVAEVPFQPRGDRPVYCNDCFSKHRNLSPRG